MDLFDFWWLSSQQSAIAELRASLNAVNRNGRTSIARQNELLKMVLQENDELRLRLGVLIRLLVQQGVISREQFSVAVNEAKANIALAKNQKVARPSAKPLQKLPKPGPSKPQ
jgi:hypothetical protein